MNEQDRFEADAICLTEETAFDAMHHPADPDKSFPLHGLKREPLLHRVMDKGKIVNIETSLKAIAAYCKSQLARLPEEHKRFENPHIFKVGISKNLRDQRNELRNQHKKQYCAHSSSSIYKMIL